MEPKGSDNNKINLSIEGIKLTSNIPFANLDETTSTYVEFGAFLSVILGVIIGIWNLNGDA